MVREASAGAVGAGRAHTCELIQRMSCKLYMSSQAADSILTGLICIQVDALRTTKA